MCDSAPPARLGGQTTLTHEPMCKLKHPICISSAQKDIRSKEALGLQTQQENR